MPIDRFDLAALRMAIDALDTAIIELRRLLDALDAAERDERAEAKRAEERAAMTYQDPDGRPMV